MNNNCYICNLTLENTIYKYDKKQNNFYHINCKCAFCGDDIEPNYFNTCEDCNSQATNDPENFIDNVLS